VCVSDPTQALHELTVWALARGYSLVDLDVRRPTLEDVYLRLTNPKEAQPA
jgi:ABC-2 type transport system ATP-binding protein